MIFSVACRVSRYKPSVSGRVVAIHYWDILKFV